MQRKYLDQGGPRIIVKIALYSLKSLGAAFRAKLAGLLHDIGYTPYTVDTDVWLGPSVNPDGAEYYEMVLCYVDDVLVISNMPMRTTDGIRSVFKLKDGKTEVRDVYLGATLSQVETETGNKCWSMSLEKYVKYEIDNL